MENNHKENKLADFDDLWRVFPKNPTKSEKDLVSLYNIFGYDSITKYLLIRSMDVTHIKQLLSSVSNSTLEELVKTAYESENITLEKIIHSIRKQWIIESDTRRKRYEECKSVLSVIKDIPSSPMIRSDDVKTYINRQMRDIANPEQFIKIRNNTVSELINYLDWTVYNTLTTEMVEIGWLGLDKLPENVIPILREKGIFGIDVFVILEGMIYPFDLKITHPGLDYFDINGWMLEQDKGGNNFQIIKDNSIPSEMKMVKEGLKRINREFREKGMQVITLKSLKEKYGSQDWAIKWPIMELLKKHNKNLFDEIIKHRNKSLYELRKNGKKLEWLNMKKQGSALFRNNNRIFVFLCFKDRIGNENEAIRLKGMTDLLTTKLQLFLTNMKVNNLNENQYDYEDGHNYTGALTTSLVFESEY